MSGTVQQRLRDFLAARDGEAELLALAEHAFAARLSPVLARRLLTTALPDEIQFQGDRVIWLAPASATDSLHDTTFVVVDLETTGTQPGQAEIIEVGAVVVRDWRIQGEHHWLVKPSRPIPPFIRGLTGIDDSMVADAPPFADIAKDVHGLFGGAVPVAHNAAFDCGFLDAAFRPLGLPEIGRDRLCTIKLARNFAPGARYSLDVVAERLGVTTHNRHRALGDARATAEVLIELLRRAESQGITSVKALRNFRKPRGRGAETRSAVGPERVRNLPPQPGIYRFRNGEGEVIYVGKAKSLRQRLGSYFVGSPRGKVNRMLAEVADFDYTVVGSELEALLEEAREIRLRQPRYNHQLRSWANYFYLYWNPNEAFPRLRLSRDHALPADVEAFGPFRFTMGGRYELKALRETFGLRNCRGTLRPSPTQSPCIEYGMKRCGAPCAELEDAAAYEDRIARLRHFLSGDPDLLRDMRTAIARAAGDENFERAASLRDRYRILTALHQAVRREGASTIAGDRLLVLPAAEEALVRLYLLRRGRAVVSVRVDARSTDFRPHLERLLTQVMQGRPAEMEDARIAESWLRRKSTLPHLRVADHPDTGSLCEGVRQLVAEGDWRRFRTLDETAEDEAEGV